MERLGKKGCSAPCSDATLLVAPWPGFNTCLATCKLLTAPAATRKPLTGAAHVVEAEDSGATLGRARQQLGGVDLNEALALQALPEQLRRWAGTEGREWDSGGIGEGVAQ